MSTLLMDMERHVQNGRLDQVVHYSKLVLNQQKQNQRAIHCHLIALIQLEKYTAATRFIENLPKTLKSNYSFELAYAYYQLSKYDTALDAIEKEKNLNRRLLLLKAQIFFKMENYSSTLGIYRNLIEKTKKDSEEYHDLLANYLATLFAGVESRKVYHAERPDAKSTSYETLFNEGSLCYSLGQFSLAISLLEKSYELCVETLKNEGMAEAEIDEEKSKIEIQLACAFYKSGNHKKSKEILKRHVKKSTLDSNTRAILYNNLLVMEESEEMLLLRDRVLYHLGRKESQQLCPFQRRQLEINLATISLLQGKYKNCRAMIKSIMKREVNNPMLFVLKAQSYLKESNEAKALELLEVRNENHRNNYIEPALAMAHFMCAKSNYQRAFQIINEMEFSSNQPGILSLKLWLLHQLGNQDQLMQTIEESLKNRNLSQIFQDGLQCVEVYYKFRSQDGITISEFKDIFENSSKQTLLAAVLLQLETALPASIQERCTEFVPVLKKKSSQTKDSENQLVSKFKLSFSTIGGAKTRKHPRKTRLPKSYDPNAQPDPERWLPLKDRSYTKYKGKKKAQMMKGSQGQVETAVIKKEELPNKEEVPSPSVNSSKPKAKPKKKKKGRF